MVSTTSSAAGDVLLDGSLRYQNVPGQSLLHNVLLEGKLQSQELQVVTPQGASAGSQYSQQIIVWPAAMLRRRRSAPTCSAAISWLSFTCSTPDTTAPTSRFHADVRGIFPGSDSAFGSRSPDQEGAAERHH